ncbi:sulfatase, partial [bacterium]|nr:sulfatase [candidate division CSSED10-310 bacterium]
MMQRPPRSLTHTCRQPVPRTIRPFLTAGLTAGLTAVTGILFMGIFSCHRQSDPPDIVLISVDTLRADHLGGYGNQRLTTPCMDRLQRMGTTVRECICQVPITLPSFASILTGRLPHRHGVRNNGTYYLPDREVTLAERLAAAGYHTAAFIGAYPLHAKFGLAQGFHYYDDRFLELGTGGAAWQSHYNERLAGEVTAAAMDWLQKRSAHPLFIWLHYYDPHLPYAPPPPFNKGTRDELYSAEVSYVDRCIERFLNALSEKSTKPLICLTADHGESLGAHGEQTHGTLLYDGTVSVPLVFVADSIPAGVILDYQAECVDIAPTLAALAGLGPNPEVDGTDFSTALRSTQAPQEKPARIESLQSYLDFGWHPLAAVRTSTVKGIKSTVDTWHDLANDPIEEQVADPDPDLVRILDRHFQQVVRSMEHTSAQREINDEELARLKALGYLEGDGSDRRPDFAALPDPADMIRQVVRLLDQASAAAAARRYEEAIELYEQVLTVNPGNPTALERCGHARFLN